MQKLLELEIKDLSYKEIIKLILIRCLHRKLILQIQNHRYHAHQNNINMDKMKNHQNNKIYISNNDLNLSYPNKLKNCDKNNLQKNNNNNQYRQLQRLLKQLTLLKMPQMLKVAQSNLIYDKIR